MDCLTSNCCPIRTSENYDVESGQPRNNHACTQYLDWTHPIAAPTALVTGVAGGCFLGFAQNVFIKYVAGPGLLAVSAVILTLGCRIGCMAPSKDLNKVIGGLKLQAQLMKSNEATLKGTLEQASNEADKLKRLLTVAKEQNRASELQAQERMEKLEIALKRLSDLQAQYAALGGIYQPIQSSLAATSAKVSDLAHTEILVQTDLKLFQSSSGKLDTIIHHLSEESGRIDSENKEFDQENKQLDELLTHFHSQIEALEASFEKIKADRQLFEKEMETQLKNNSQLAGEIKELSQTLQDYKELHALIDKKLNQLESSN